jgi:hypothetical protein
MLLHMSSRQSNGSEPACNLCSSLLLDTGLNRAASEIETELGRPETLHTKEWTAHFGHAFDLDLIGPDDF